jgi:hypothetical protein
MATAKTRNIKAKRTPVVQEHTTASGSPLQAVEAEVLTYHIETSKSGLPEKVVWWVGDPFS